MEKIRNWLILAFVVLASAMYIELLYRLNSMGFCLDVVARLALYSGVFIYLLGAHRLRWRTHVQYWGAALGMLAYLLFTSGFWTLKWHADLMISYHELLDQVLPGVITCLVIGLAFANLVKALSQFWAPPPKKTGKKRRKP